MATKCLKLFLNSYCILVKSTIDLKFKLMNEYKFKVLYHLTLLMHEKYQSWWNLSRS